MSEPLGVTATSDLPHIPAQTDRLRQHANYPAIIAATVGLVALADWLFVFQSLPGAVVGAFGLAVLIAVVSVHGTLLENDRARWALALALLMCAALLNDPSALGIALFIAAMLFFQASGAAATGTAAHVVDAVRAGWHGVMASVLDVIGLPSLLAAAGWRGRAASLAAAWFVPVLGAAIFLFLFAAANPIIAQWLSAIEGARWLDGLPTADRVMFWVMVASGIWWLLRSRLPAGDVSPDRGSARDGSMLERSLTALVPAPAIVRSMLVFNLIFALQNGLDAVYLWGNGPLPEGFTYASYAHRGAYPLMVTAVLAAVFVLVAFRDGATFQAGRLARPLMFVWIAQNIVLVASSIWRMVLYVEAYSLSYARLVALAWMTLVAFGLVLMVWRFAWCKTNRWLVEKNLVACLATLCGATLFDAGGFIAAYNVRHSRDVGGRGVVLDLGYLARIGPRALPALKAYAAVTAPDPIEGAASLSDWRRHQHALRLIERLEVELSAAQGDWRRWSYFGHRLKQRVSRP